MYGQPYVQNSYPNQQAPNNVVPYPPQQNVTFASSGHPTTTATVPSQMNMSTVMTTNPSAGYSLSPAPAPAPTYPTPFNPSTTTTATTTSSSSSHNHHSSANVAPAPSPHGGASTRGTSGMPHPPPFSPNAMHHHHSATTSHHRSHHPNTNVPPQTQPVTAPQPPARHQTVGPAPHSPQPWSFTQNASPLQNPAPMHNPSTTTTTTTTSPSLSQQHHQQHMMLSESLPITGPNASPPSPQVGVPFSSVMGVGEVSAVLHLRNVDANVAQMSIEAFVQRFGQIKRLVMLRQKHQALIEMGSVQSAQDLIEAIRETGFADIDGTRVYIRYSTHQELTSIQQPSCILFVSMQSNDYDLTSAAMDPEIIYSIFSKYGRIRKLVIVSKGERGAVASRQRYGRFNINNQSMPPHGGGGGVQALVQFHSTEDAEYVKRVLQGQPVTLGNSVNLSLDIQFSRMADLKVINPATSLLVDEQGHVSRPSAPHARVSAPVAPDGGRGGPTPQQQQHPAASSPFLGPPGCPPAAGNSCAQPQQHHHHHHHHIHASFMPSNMNPGPQLTVMTQNRVPQQLYAPGPKPNWE